MFKIININLTGPICSCLEQSLGWGIGIDNKSQATLFITCKICKTKLNVPNEKFVASFKLDEAYPGKQKEQIKEEEQRTKQAPTKEVINNLIKVDFNNSSKKEKNNEEPNKD